MPTKRRYETIWLPFPCDMNFSLPIGRMFGIEIRLHWTLLVYAGFLVLIPWPHDVEDLLTRFGFVALVWGSVLLHEFGHSFAGRFCDGQSDSIMLWPLGGLAYVTLPSSPVAHFLTALGGPLVSLSLWGIASVLAPLTTGLAAIFVGFFVWFNLTILLFNLIPAFPMDGGRLLQAALWRNLGYFRSMWVCLHLSMLIAVILFIVSFFAPTRGQSSMLMAMIAVWVFFSAWMERQFLAADAMNTEFSSGRPGVPWNHPYRTAKSEGGFVRRKWKIAPAQKNARPPTETVEMDAEEFISKEVDPILDKISKQGIQSLTARERRILEKARQKIDKKS